jgi:hypothetical protein
MSLLRRSLVLGAVALAMSATTASAQMMSKPKEVRIDMAQVMISDGTTGIDLGFPGSLAIAIYLNDNIAIEPNFNLGFLSGDGFSGGNFGVGVMVPYYLAGDQGKTGFFVAPGLMLGKGFGDFDSDMAVDFGVDLGIKREWKGNVGQRFAITLRDGDSYADMVFGAVAGITLRWP